MPSPPPDPLTPKAEARRREILATSMRYFARADYDDVSLDDIADELEISHGLIFRYFGSKKGLYAAGIEALLVQFRETAMAGVPDDDPSDRFRVGLRAYIEWAAEHPRGFNALVVTGAGFQEVHEEVESTRWEAIGAMARLFGLNPGEPKVGVALRAWGGYVDNAILAWLELEEPRTDPGVDELIALAVGALDATVAGLGEPALEV